jgi:hypothetical protein
MTDAGFALRMDDFCATFPLRLGLSCDRPDHLFGQLHLSSTGVTLMPHDAVWWSRIDLQAQVQFTPLAQQFIEFGFAQNAPQSPSAQLGGGV